MFKPCAIVPVYNHPDTIAKTLKAIGEYNLDMLVVDDGSEPHCQQVLENIAQQIPAVRLLRLTQNLGKGGAVKAGIKKALQLGYSHGLQIDADGQHAPEDIPRFLSLAEQRPNTLISGQPEYDQSVPGLRFYARYLTHIWVWINCLSFTIKDSMCGFRIYPLHRSCELIDKYHLGDRMDFDTEVMVKWYWHFGDIEQFPTRIRYPEDGISHFRGWHDNWLISKMHTRLFFGMLRRCTSLLSRSSNEASNV